MPLGTFYLAYKSFLYYIDNFTDSRTFWEVQMKIIVKVKGGPHSGNFGHAGIPGSVGGSAPGGSMLPILESYHRPSEFSSAFPTTSLSEDAVDSWRGHGPRENRKLRSGKSSKLANSIESAMVEQTEDVVVHRGFRTNDPLPKVGDVVVDAGILSTSLDGAVAEGAAIGEGYGSVSGKAVVYTIFAPKGARSVNIENISPIEEHEILYPRNSKLRILKVVPQQGSQYDDYSVIYAEILPYGEE